MKQHCLILAFVVGNLACLPNIGAAAPSNPYVEPITKRNLFLLNSTPTSKPAATPTKLPDVKLCGITTLASGKRALLRVQRPAHPPEPAKVVSLLIGEGASAVDGVQVIEINVSAATVKIVNHGTIQTLSLQGIGSEEARPETSLKHVQR